MSRGAMRNPLVSLVATAGAVLALAACGSSSDDGAGTGTTSASAGGGSADVSGAKAAVAPFIGRPSPFPVTERLSRRPEGATVAYMNGGSPVGTLLWEFLKPAAATMGVEVEQYKAGPGQNVTTDGFDSVVAARPDAVFDGAIDPARWSSQLEELRADGVKVIGTAIDNGEKYGLDPVQGGRADMERNGRLLANYVVGHMEPDADVVIYDVAELGFTRLISGTFVQEMRRICPDCKVRVSHIPVATIGNTAPNTIVSDLQANPDTNVAVFASDEVQHGLPEALRKAGIEIQTLGYAPDPVNLQYLKEGKETAVLATDLSLSVWTILDQAARELTGQRMTGPQAEGLNVVQFLTPEDVTGDVSHGWTGYPDYPERFAELWGVGRR